MEIEHNIYNQGNGLLQFLLVELINIIFVIIVGNACLNMFFKDKSKFAIPIIIAGIVLILGLLKVRNGLNSLIDKFSVLTLLIGGGINLVIYFIPTFNMFSPTLLAIYYFILLTQLILFIVYRDKVHTPEFSDNYIFGLINIINISSMIPVITLKFNIIYVVVSLSILGCVFITQYILSYKLKKHNLNEMDKLSNINWIGIIIYLFYEILGILNIVETELKVVFLVIFIILFIITLRKTRYLYQDKFQKSINDIEKINLINLGRLSIVYNFIFILSTATGFYSNIFYKDFIGILLAISIWMLVIDGNKRLKILMNSNID